MTTTSQPLPASGIDDGEDEAATALDQAQLSGDAEVPSGDGTDEQSCPELAHEEKRRPRWLRVFGAAFVIAVLVAALVFSSISGWQLWEQRQISAAGGQAQEAAVAYAQTLTSIDSDKVDENFTDVLDGATGEFKDMYTQSSMQLRQLLIDNKATAQGTVVDSAIQSESQHKVVVLLMVDQTVTNTGRPDPRVDRSRMKITMEKVDGRWLASKVELP